VTEAEAELDIILREREALEPKFFERLRALPAVKRIIAAMAKARSSSADIAELELLRECAWARSGRDNYRLRTETAKLENVAIQLKAAAAALSRLPAHLTQPSAAMRSADDIKSADSKHEDAAATIANLLDRVGLSGIVPNATYSPIRLAGLRAATAAFRALKLDAHVGNADASINAEVNIAFVTLAHLLTSKEAMAVALRTLADELNKIVGRLKPTGPLEETAKKAFLQNLILLGLPSDHALYADVAALYGFAFEQPAPRDMAHLLRRARKTLAS
jgi:hypothetical protein